MLSRCKQLDIQYKYATFPIFPSPRISCDKGSGGSLAEESSLTATATRGFELQAFYLDWWHWLPFLVSPSSFVFSETMLEFFVGLGLFSAF